MSPATSTTSCDRALDLPSRPFPGDLYLDPAVPAGQRVRVGQGRWRAEATHVWTGTGWTRLVAGQVRPVPDAGPAHRRPALPPVPVGQVEQVADAVGATVTELRPSASSPVEVAARRRRRRYAAHEHRWAC